jgi:hypothetical protein
MAKQPKKPVKTAEDYEIDLTHLRYDLELLRGRMIRYVNDSLGYLNQGLCAMQRDVPKPHIMLENMEILAEKAVKQQEYLNSLA